MPSYAKEDIRIALELFDQEKNATRVVRILGYPTTATLYNWLRQRNSRLLSANPNQRTQSEKGTTSFYKHRKSATVDEKLDALKRCFQDGEDVRLVSDQIGFSRQSIHKWRRIVEKNGIIGLMNNDKKKILNPELLDSRSTEKVETKDIESLKEEVKALKMEVDILKEALNLLKKDKGIDFVKLRNVEKFTLINALKQNYSLSNLLFFFALSRSSYYCHLKKLGSKSKYDELKELIRALFEQNRSVYGYRRIKILLNKQGLCISEKIIRRLMREMNLVPLYTRKKKKYSSYVGEITTAPENIVNRNFNSDRPNEIWLTDITEFALFKDKVYLSPVVDCFDGKLVSWNCSTSPNAELVNDSLVQACLTVDDENDTIVHTDRGVHYRWDQWIKITEENNLVRSMSKKGCTGDNAACEGVFGRIKNECFYHKDFRNMDTADFINYLNDYLNWYNEDRIKQKFGCSINENRRKLGY